MSIRDSIRRIVGRQRQQVSQIEAMEQRLAQLETRLRSAESKGDAVAVLPGSTYFSPDQIRQVKVTQDSAAGEPEFQFMMQTPAEDGTPMDDPDEPNAMTGRKPDDSVALVADQIVGVTVEGTDGAGDLVYWLASSPGGAVEPGDERNLVFITDMEGDQLTVNWAEVFPLSQGVAGNYLRKTGPGAFDHEWDILRAE